jgi:hypothetical protein
VSAEGVFEAEEAARGEASHTSEGELRRGWGEREEREERKGVSKKGGGRERKTRRTRCKRSESTCACSTCGNRIGLLRFLGRSVGGVEVRGEGKEREERRRRVSASSSSLSSSTASSRRSGRGEGGEHKKREETHIQNLVIPLQSPPPVPTASVRVSLFLEEPKALHLDEVFERRRGVFLLVRSNSISPCLRKEAEEGKEERREERVQDEPS